MKTPLEMVASAVRASTAKSTTRFRWPTRLRSSASRCIAKQEPTGYSNSSQEWLNSGGLLARMNFALQLADNKVPGVKVEPRRTAADRVAGLARVSKAVR